MENKSTNKNKSLKTITYEPYMKRIVEAVVDDYKFLGKEFKYIEDVIDYVNNSIKDSPYYSPPEFETAQTRINRFLKSKKGIPKKTRYTSTLKDLQYYSLQEYYKLKLTPENLLDIEFPDNDNSYHFYPIATLFVKKGIEKDINDILIEHFEDFIQGTITGSKCIMIYFKNYDKFIDFLRMFFPDRVAEDDENIQQSNAVDDIDDSDDKTEEKEKHKK